MKISNETKVGALTAIAIVILILGFNFLKGRNLADRSDKIYAEFPSVEGLQVSNPVFIKGLQVGKVYAMKEKDENLSGVIVTISLNKRVNIPKNSLATIGSELLGTSSVKINMGNSPTYIQDGDTLSTMKTLGLADKLQSSLDPTLAKVNKTLESLDLVLHNLNSTLDPNTKNNLQSIIANLTNSSKSLEKLLDAQTGMLAKTLANTESVTGNLAKNNDKINATVDNLEKATGKLANAKFDEAVASLQSTMAKLEATVDKVNSNQSSLGALLNDRKLYDQLLQTNRSLTTLLDDLRMHPKRYVNISVFGKKDKKGPLMSPIYDSTSTKQGNQ
ncbi:MCE family protein [Pseudoflavitalea sp. X16]|uniref:MlaD family protein n=1 Tax=Paraflavitalea devenefica TaxID=2716334 RepID=UPI00141E72FF|nr:MlaD family protein [Paraflavitalea devenefica]NII29036.1 MCE family protein [Paraflavitalea devenefica]